MPQPIELPKLGKRRLNASETAEVAPALAEAYGTGMSLRAIASDTGRSYGWVHRTLTDFGTPLRARGSQPLHQDQPLPTEPPAPPAPSF